MKGRLGRSFRGRRRYDRGIACISVNEVLIQVLMPLALTIWGDSFRIVGFGN